MEGSQEIDPYSILCLQIDASDDEIQQAYIKFCKLFHPDRFEKQSEKNFAEKRYVEVQSAYKLLSVPEHRLAYDLKMKQHQETHSNLVLCDKKAETMLDVLNQKIKKLDQLNKEITQNAPSGLFSIKLDMRDLFIPETESELLHSQSSLSVYFPSIVGIRMNQRFKFYITDRDYVTFHGLADVDDHRGKGDGSIVLHHQQTDSLFHKIGVIFHNVHRLSYHIGYQLSQNLVVQSGLNFALHKNAPIFLWNSELYGNINSKTSFDAKINFNGIPAINLSIQRNFGPLTLGAASHVGINRQSVSLDASFPVTSSTIVSTSVGADAQNFTFSYGLRKHISLDSLLGFFVSYKSAKGVKMAITYQNRSQRFHIPIILCDELDFSPILYGNLFGMLSYSLLHGFFIARLFKLEKERKRKEAIEKSEHDRMKSFSNYVSYQNLMRDSYRRIVSSENEKKGLVIVVALYGRLIQDGNKDMNTATLTPSNNIIDVTIPLQCLVDRSVLILPSTSKANIQGFYDVAPGQEKFLMIRYSFRGELHHVTCPDREACSIPKKSHKMMQNK